MLKTNKKGCSKLWEALKSICNNSATYLVTAPFSTFWTAFLYRTLDFQSFFEVLLEPSGNWQFGSSNEPV